MTEPKWTSETHGILLNMPFLFDAQLQTNP